jgi:hypothetical protein
LLLAIAGLREAHRVYSSLLRDKNSNVVAIHEQCFRVKLTEAQLQKDIGTDVMHLLAQADEQFQGVVRLAL